MKTCSVEGCASSVFSRAMCQKHYTRWLKRGSATRGDSPPPVPAGMSPVEGFAGYAADPGGTVWSCHVRGGAGGFGERWTILKSRLDKDGYPSVTLFRERQRCTRKVAHIILETFVSPRPAGAESLHYPDPSPTNNAVSNLQWGTHQTNIAHKTELGTVARGTQHGMAKIDETIVRAIREKRATTNLSYAKLGKLFGLHPAHIHDIVKRKSWGHVD